MTRFYCLILSVLVMAPIAFALLDRAAQMVA